MKPLHEFARGLWEGLEILGIAVVGVIIGAFILALILELAA